MKDRTLKLKTKMNKQQQKKKSLVLVLVLVGVLSMVSVSDPVQVLPIQTAAKGMSPPGS